MSPDVERSALVTLFSHAERLHLLAPDEPLPQRGLPFPDEDAHRSRGHDDDTPHQVLKADVVAAVETFLASPDGRPEELHEALTRLSLPVVAGLAARGLPFTPDPERARTVGLRLVRYGTDRRAVMIGLALLRGTARREDVPLVRMVGLLGPLPGRRWRSWPPSRVRRPTCCCSR